MLPHCYCLSIYIYICCGYDAFRLVVALMGKSHDRNTFGIQQQNDPGVLLLKGLNPAFPSVVSHFLNGKLDSHVNG